MKFEVSRSPEDISANENAGNRRDYHIGIHFRIPDMIWYLTRL